MSSGFVTEAEIEAAKQKRQEEWEKVRQPDQPLGKQNEIMFNYPSMLFLLFSNSEVAEVPYDNRSLYEKLKEQKDKKDYEFEEAHKLSECHLYASTWSSHLM